MSVDNFTPIAVGAPGNASTFNSALGELDQALGPIAAIAEAAPNCPSSAVEALLELLAEIGTIAELEVGDGATNLVAAANGLQTILGVTTFSARLKEWALSGAWEWTNPNYHSSITGLVVSSTIKWPDGSAGTYTATSVNDVWQAADSFTLYHAGSGLTVSQPAVTRDVYGQVTAPPELTVS